MRKLNNKAADYIASVVILIMLMIGIIIGSIVFFAFADAGTTAQSVTNTQDVVSHATTELITMSRPPDDNTPALVVHRYNTSSSTWELIAAGSVTQNTNDTVLIAAAALDANSSQIRAVYNARGYTEVQGVVTYAITVFALMAIIPLLIVGGLMLRSLGFMTGGGENV